jgi:hypothetical protein
MRSVSRTSVWPSCSDEADARARQTREHLIRTNGVERSQAIKDRDRDDHRLTRRREWRRA